ncbi:MAG: carbohydrate ABC transporter permease [Anaerolineaceae bacterium]|nr:MAG: carbohydrate ABC transporter permease [Anaerolineaceae bacterium]
MASVTSVQKTTERDLARVTSIDVKTARRRRNLLNQFAITLLAVILLSIYLMPLAYGGITSLKTSAQASDSRAPILPMSTTALPYEGRQLDIYTVPIDGEMLELALLRAGRQSSTFINPADLDAEPIEWEGNWRQLEPVRELDVQWSNYSRAWNAIRFARLLGNTMMYALVTMFGTLIASSLTAYGFARFRFPGKNILFMVLISTIILPPAVTLVPTYAFFVNVLGWGGSWLPLIVPQMFGNAYNVFLLRQYFLTIPRELEEAAYIDGAGPFRTFISIILPQAMPALTAVALFHFFFAWNDFFGPLIYLAGSRDLNPITVGLTEFNGLYSSEPNLILAAAIISMILPLAIFFMAQRVFIQGIVITGVDK